LTVAALLITTAPLAYAVTAPASHTLQPNQIRASKMIGSSVYSSQNAVKQAFESTQMARYRGGRLAGRAREEAGCSLTAY
jgi:hypothetical protein